MPTNNQLIKEALRGIIAGIAAGYIWTFSQEFVIGVLFFCLILWKLEWNRKIK